MELSGELMGQFFIDVLVRSSQSFIETFNFIQKNVLKKFEDLCNVTQGCQGVTLVKAILRLEVVKKLILCKNRKDQAVLVNILK